MSIFENFSFMNTFKSFRKYFEPLQQKNQDPITFSGLLSIKKGGASRFKSKVIQTIGKKLVLFSVNYFFKSFMEFLPNIAENQ